MSDGAGKAVAGFLGIGLAYWIALGIAEAAVFAVMALIVAIIVGGAIGIVALIAWGMCLREAVEQRDWGWVTDLLVAPGAAVFCVLVFANDVALKIRDFEASDFVAQGNKTLSHGAPLFLSILLGPVAGILFLVCLIATPILLGFKRPVRFLAYPGFVFFALYLSGLSIAIHNGWDDSKGAKASLEQEHAVSMSVMRSDQPMDGVLLSLGGQ